MDAVLGPASGPSLILPRQRQGRRRRAPGSKRMAPHADGDPPHHRDHPPQRCKRTRHLALPPAAQPESVETATFSRTGQSPLPRASIPLCSSFHQGVPHGLGLAARPVLARSAHPFQGELPCPRPSLNMDPPVLFGMSDILFFSPRRAGPPGPDRPLYPS